MSFKINMPSVQSGPSQIGPSKSYYETQARFQSILENKLNVKATPDVTETSKVSRAKTEDQGFDAQNVLLKSGVSADALNEKLEGTALAGLGNDFVAAEQKYGINAWFLTGLAIHESGFGTSRIAQDKNNIFGFRAYDATPYSSAAQFDSRGDSIDKVAQYLAEHYTNPSGKYFNGISVDAIGKRYATDPNWSNALQSRVAQLMKLG
ncbi:glucosaminidase domain-containing protein [Fusibacter ferrireducens]|uniref:Glucosaminidase domain-containing protein n=1 Tax=Fusibacter ferrireducens TaxID=2785058 RepID=A0ABR9ZRY8_9FIRM|nr:glucosaminidase domain-containing protein [Fusibacter ferrireducens]MBF4692883.1 glucosaminidase domain-containing protein [Fusibacter ferrireducens]